MLANWNGRTYQSTRDSFVLFIEARSASTKFQTCKLRRKQKVSANTIRPRGSLSDLGVLSVLGG